MSRNTFLYARFSIVMLIWGGMELLVMMVSQPAMVVALVRMGLGSLVILLFILKTGESWNIVSIKKNALWMFLGGAGMALSTSLNYEAFRCLSVSVAILIFYSGPVVVILLSPLLVKEKLTAAKLAGSMVALLGVFFINGTGQLTGSNPTRGLICAVLAVGMYVLTVVCNKKIRDLSNLQITFSEMLSGVVVLLPIVVLTHDGPVHIEGAKEVLLLVLLGVVNGGLLNYVYFASLQQMRAQSVVLISYLEPFSTLVCSALFLHERLTMLQIIGAVLLLGGAAYGNLGDYLRAKHKKNTHRLEGERNAE